MSERRNGSRLRAAATAGVSLLALLAGPAAGQQSAAIEEIVVTALKRDQTLQEVPVSVTAFTAKTIEQSGITRPIDFINATPNLTAVEANNAGDLRITIRGDAQALNTDAPVAVVIDGVVLTGATGLNKDLLDVQQIEVLKGPQGYLYGRNAISGAINITTRAPTDEFTGSAKFGYGNGSTATAALTASGPVVKDKLAVSIAGTFRDSNGFYENVTLKRNVDPYNEKSGRFRADWTPTEALRVQGSVFIARIKGAATNYLSQSLFVPLQTSSPILSADFADAPFVSNIQNFNDKKDDLVSLRIDYTQAWGTITSISSYERQNNIFASDGYPYSPGPGDGTQWNQRHHRAYTTELRFTSPSDQALRYIFGGWYADIEQSPFLLAAVGEDNGFVRRDRPPIFTGANRTTGFSADNIKGDAWALFANVDYDIGDALTLTIAGRYDREKKKATDVAFGRSAVTGAAFSTTAGRVRQATYDKFQPKASLSYKVNDDATLYATYAVGFKAGGFNAVQAFTTTGGRAPNDYPAEKAENFEIGAKTEWFDNRLTANVALFRTEKNNSQLFQFIPQGFLNAVTVIDKIRVTGGELELVARPVEPLTIRAGIGYTDAEIRLLRSRPREVGNAAPYVPNWKTSLDATYEIPVAEGLSLAINGRWDHIGRIFFDTAQSAPARRSALDLFSARVSLDAENWSVALWGKNLTDKRYNSDVIVIFSGDPLPFTQAVFKAPPRTYGAEVTVRF
jgi:iron complex outermembrane receptor protein